MDKSSASNSWNILKTSGTNIISGPYLGGNYFDDYTGSDGDGDGLGDTPYTIYAGNKDNLPIVDINAPSISNVAASPSSQTTGSYVYLSATVTDNIAVSNVYLVITYPGSQTYTISITQNNTGSLYYCNKTYTTVGTYSFYIKAIDARSNWGSTSSNPSTFEIHEGTPPTVTDNSPTSGSPGGSFIFNATVTDDEDSASELTVKVVWNHGTLRGNTTMTNTN